MSRAETTAMLSKLVEKRLRNQTAFWASEVNFDRNTPDERRVDYVGSNRGTSTASRYPQASRKAASSSTSQILHGRLHQRQRIDILRRFKFPRLHEGAVRRDRMAEDGARARERDSDTGFDRLELILGHVQSYNDMSYRRRPASEILWAMVKANGKRTN